MTGSVMGNQVQVSEREVECNRLADKTKASQSFGLTYLSLFLNSWSFKGKTSENSSLASVHRRQIVNCDVNSAALPMLHFSHTRIRFFSRWLVRFSNLGVMPQLTLIDAQQNSQRIHKITAQQTTLIGLKKPAPTQTFRTNATHTVSFFTPQKLKKKNCPTVTCPDVAILRVLRKTWVQNVSPSSHALSTEMLRSIFCRYVEDFICQHRCMVYSSELIAISDNFATRNPRCRCDVVALAYTTIRIHFESHLRTVKLFEFWIHYVIRRLHFCKTQWSVQTEDRTGIMSEETVKETGMCQYLSATFLKTTTLTLRMELFATGSCK